MSGSTSSSLSVRPEPGQLWLWRETAGSRGEVFLVTGLFEPNRDGEVFVIYLMNGEEGWDDIDWITSHGELISEAPP